MSEDIPTAIARYHRGNPCRGQPLKQAGAGFNDFGLEFKNPDFVKYAESYGARGVRITETGQLPAVLEECFAAGGVHLVEVPIDYSENEKVFLEELRSASCSLDGGTP